MKRYHNAGVGSDDEHDAAQVLHTQNACLRSRKPRNFTPSTRPHESRCRPPVFNKLVQFTPDNQGRPGLAEK